MATDKIIELSGIVRNTKDSASKDGECDEIINLRFKDGSWRPVGTLKNVDGYESLETFGYERLFVHTNEYRHLLGVKDGNLYWIGDIDDNSTITPFVVGGGGAYSQAQLVKENVSLNMRICQTGHLMVVIDDGLSYFMFRVLANKYEAIITDYNNIVDGRLLPYGNIEFRVDLDCDDRGRPFFFSDYIEDSGFPLHDNDIEKKAEVLSDVIYKTQKNVTALNRFWGAFLVCTAAELYDGTFILASQPALMLLPNVKSSSRTQNVNLAYINSQTYQPLKHDWAEYLDVNQDFCERIYQRYNTNYGSFPSGLIPLNARCNDIRDGYCLLYYQLHSQNAMPILNLPTQYNKVDFKYNHDLITDTDFTAVAMDTYRQLDPTHRLFDAQHVAVNVKEELPFHANFKIGNETTCCHHLVNKLRFKITTAISAEYRDVIKNVSVFITPQAQVMDLKHNLSEYKGYDNFDSTYYNELHYNLRPTEDIIKELMKEPMFYKIGEIEMNVLCESNVGKWIDLPIEEGVLTNLLSQTRLTLDSVGRDSYNAKVSFSYNNRLHIADYIDEKFHGWLIDHFFYSEGVGQFEEGSVGVVANSNRHTIGWIKVTLSSDGVTRVLVRDIPVPVVANGQMTSASQSKTIRYLNPMLSYPSRDAISMEIFIRNATTIPGISNTFHETYALTAHEYMNYAYYISPDLKPIDTHLTKSESWQDAPQEYNNTETFHNRIKVSLTSNPLYFPYETTYAVGNGKIIGLAANELVLATGQIGDAPLYVFCSDGTFGFFVDDSGQLAYNFSRVLSEYVCNNAGGIFNIHGGVMFPTDKGYVLLNGLETKDVTDKIEGRPWDITEIPELGKITNHSRLVSLISDITQEDFIDFIKGCVGGYNFADKEVWLSNKEKGYTYIIDRFGQYSKRTDCGVQLVNDFPRTYLLDVNESEGVKVSTLRNLLNEDKNVRQTLFLTRAMKDGTQEFKQTERLILRGEFHLPTSEEYDVKFIDLTLPKSVSALPLIAKAPEDIIDVYENTVIAPNIIVPQMIYKGWIAVCDLESTMDVKDTDSNYIDLTDNDATFSSIKDLFKVGYLTDHTLGWRSLDPSDADSVQYSITPDGDRACGYAVKLKFGNNRPYLVRTQHSLSVSVYCFDELEITCDDFAKLLNNLEIPGVCLRIYDGTTYTNKGLYMFNSNLSNQDQISITDKGNYRSAYLYYDRTQTPKVAIKDEREWRIETIPNGTVNCLDFIQDEIVSNIHGIILSTIYDNLVNVAVRNNTLYLDEGKMQYVTFSARLNQTTTDTYDNILQAYNNGTYAPATFTSFNKYNLPRKSYVRLIDVNGDMVKIIYYTGTGTVTWAQLNAYAAAPMVYGSTTLTLKSGQIYHIDIGFYDTNNVYRSLDVIKKYIGPNGTMSLFAIYTDITMPSHSPKFRDLTSADYLSAYNLYVKEGDYLTVKYYSESMGEEVTVNIQIGANEMIDGETFVSKIENGDYLPWKAVDKLAGLYLFGSYDNRKWHLLGARELCGDFRDLGLIAYRVDCKYFKLLFVGQLEDRSSIEYIEHIISGRVFGNKRR